ncbi:hypothetical protein [Corynebacterium sp. TAE3-ERU16]|uniref:hypothetical protein n=1 Tax=Corynebacterium sp. TAE3-ERU16 TaxID=2849493 RepID=UPI001C43B0B2|nr:hypothetical protein [Corynebacterium sp. TAE3-ERU16]MBV7292388.1 hypothetical protein [Corynebacterium sp. TAE3-ERU16]
MADSSNFSGRFEGRFVDDDDVRGSGRVWAEFDNTEGFMTLPLSQDYKDLRDNLTTLESQGKAFRDEARGARDTTNGYLAQVRGLSSSAETARNEARSAAASATESATAAAGDREAASGLVSEIQGAESKVRVLRDETSTFRDEAESFAEMAQSVAETGMKARSVERRHLAAGVTSELDSKASKEDLKREIAATGSGNMIPTFNGRPVWAEGLEESDEVPPATDLQRSYGGHETSTIYPEYMEISSGTPYYFECWIKAPVEGTIFYLELRDRAGENAIASGAIGRYGDRYIFNKYDVPTEWTRVSTILRFNRKVTAVRFKGIFFNHPSGEKSEQNTLIAGMRLVSLPPDNIYSVANHKHIFNDIIGFPDGVSKARVTPESSTVAVRTSTGALQVADATAQNEAVNLKMLNQRLYEGQLNNYVQKALLSDAADGAQGTVVSRNAAGSILVSDTPNTDGSAVNSKWVKKEIRATSFTDLSDVPEQVTGMSYYNAGETVVVRHSDGHIEIGAPTAGSHAATKKYVDDRTQDVSRTKVVDSADQATQPGIIYFVKGS